MTTSTAGSAQAGPGAGEGTIALVTGGSKGIGLATAYALAAVGTKVVVTGRNQSALDAAVAGAPAGATIHAVRADVQHAEDAARAVAAAVTTFGGLDVLVNNAGVGAFLNVSDMSTSDWERTIGTNLSGVFYCCRAALPELRRRGGGWIISISSLASSNPFAGGAAYCASKAGLNAFSEALMQEVRYDNIRVSCILPGSVATGFGGRETGADWKLAPDDVARVVVDLIEHPARSLPSRIELRPSRPHKK
jgi:3-oxoacyl-[acyl-carrier protein] reductase